jgi:mannose/fructose-specific phosphotransferase system component IIA
MSESTAVRGVVLTHGEMAAGLVDAVRKIAGIPTEALIPVSNEGYGPESLQSEMRQIVGEGPAVIFTDLRMGSCALVARMLCRDHDRVRVLCGVNLAMLLDFAFHRDLSLDDLVDRLVEKGREGVQSLAAVPSHGNRSV